MIRLLLLTNVASMVLATVAIYLALPAAEPITGLDTTPATTMKVVAPASPGLASAEEICSLGQKNESIGPDGNRYIVAQHGMSILEYLDNGNTLGLVDGEPVVLSGDVIKCLTKQ